MINLSFIDYVITFFFSFFHLLLILLLDFWSIFCNSNNKHSSKESSSCKPRLRYKIWQKFVIAYICVRKYRMEKIYDCNSRKSYPYKKTEFFIKRVSSCYTVECYYRWKYNCKYFKVKMVCIWYYPAVRRDSRSKCDCRENYWWYYNISKMNGAKEGMHSCLGSLCFGKATCFFCFFLVIYLQERSKYIYKD